ncbi:MAG: hypothetical protein PHW07_08375 [Sulfurospirillaceae bacterium]|nr:hypothetical protein [Sulfurospirillaceae bacterium]
MKKYIVFLIAIGVTIGYFMQDKNNLEKISTPTKNITYMYDKQGCKTQKSINHAVKERYFWLGCEKLNLVADENGKVLRQYIYQNKHALLPIGMLVDGQTFTFVFNTMNSLRVVQNSKGQIVKVIDYDDSGVIIKDTNPSFKVDFSYAGGLWDEDARLLFYAQGVYDPNTHRWISKVKDIDIIENLKQLSATDEDEVYQCKATLDVYYHAYLCVKGRCGGLYATDYLNYFNGKGAMIDNSIYFNSKQCQPIKLSKQYDKTIFASCVSQYIKPKQDLVFDAWQHNCHHEVSDIIAKCSQNAFIKGTSDN